jgi:hypothetical protein
MKSFDYSQAVDVITLATEDAVHAYAANAESRRDLSRAKAFGVELNYLIGLRSCGWLPAL